MLDNTRQINNRHSIDKRYIFDTWIIDTRYTVNTYYISRQQTTDTKQILDRHILESRQDHTRSKHENIEEQRYTIDTQQILETKLGHIQAANTVCRRTKIHNRHIVNTRWILETRQTNKQQTRYAGSESGLDNGFLHDESHNYSATTTIKLKH